MENDAKTARDAANDAPTLYLSGEVLQDIIMSIGMRPAESGGPFGGHTGTSWSTTSILIAVVAIPPRLTRRIIDNSTACLRPNGTRRKFAFAGSRIAIPVEALAHQTAMNSTPYASSRPSMTSTSCGFQ